MATDFTKNQISVSNTMSNQAANMPLDLRTVIDTIADKDNIPMPFVGMIFYVKDEKKLYSVVSLKDKESAIGIPLPNQAINAYRPLIESAIYATSPGEYYTAAQEDALMAELELKIKALEEKLASDL